MDLPQCVLCTLNVNGYAVPVENAIDQFPTFSISAYRVEWSFTKDVFPE